VKSRTTSAVRALILTVIVTASAWPLAARASKADDTLVWGRDTEVAQGDVYYAVTGSNLQINEMVCDGLLYRNTDTGAYEPLLAKSYKWVDDKTIEFQLRDDVVFHDGQKFSAEDVKYTFDHITAPNSGVISRNIVDWIQATEMVSPYTVRIHLKEPLPMALEYMASGILPIYPKGHWDSAPTVNGRKDYGAVPVNCTGPYKITKLVPGQTVDMVRNDKYFDGPKGHAKIGKLQYRTILDHDAQLVELLSGNVDWLWDVARDKADQMKEMDQVQVVSTQILRFLFISFDVAGKGGPNPFQDLRVRQAINYGINSASIAKNLVGPGSERIDAMCDPPQFGCIQDVKTYDYDPDKAKQLLAEAGYPNGFSIDLFTYFQPEFGEAVVNDLRQIGVNANLRLIQLNALRPMVRNGQAKMTLLSWGSNRMNDSAASVSYYFKGADDDMVMDPQVIDWLKTADNSIDPERRKEFYAKALNRIADQAYCVPMFTLTMYYAASKDLVFKPYFDDLPRFYRANWK
jgi:peptide/nickel transport system substrate-binding protein